MKKLFFVAFYTSRNRHLHLLLFHKKMLFQITTIALASFFTR
ncbi:hypothetical protein GNIT_0796 [Glaciecola nitratireducens FR1064]|uniref:Uncharacterized protein n=1 Tax=Glaciecola nitratireducens (strain JCM 12485 / KCTC 12276 / FR1064) TaxID=1085623 RepID=G4QJ72_GLANF|nr:hypothetical protein GNIT_0796 [Glaciecola nitratireducens FR1064]